MKRSEALAKIKEAIQGTMGSDPETLEPLHAPEEYVATAVLKAIEEIGMLPPYATFRMKIDGKEYECDSQEWENEKN